jgi:phosphomannomutase
MIRYVFDVDGTLTPSRSRIDEEFRLWFVDFISKNSVWLVTGSDYDKTLEQLGPEICENVVTCYNCQGNDVWHRGKRVNTKSFTAPKDLENLLLGWLQASLFPLRTGNHIEKRRGMWNFSIVGRNATMDERAEYVKYDELNRERESIAYQINSEFENITATVGGETGIDIGRTGGDKRQILEDFNEDDDIRFFGDKMEPGGNDYPLAKANKRGKNYHVKDWRDTYNKLTQMADTAG